MLPAEIAEQIMAVIEAIEAKLKSLASMVAAPSENDVDDSDPVTACRLALIDLTLDQNVAALDQLGRFIAMEESSYHPQQ